MDGAANAGNALLPRYWDQDQDGLQQDWSQENVWCNPPYSRPGPFLKKASTARLAVVLLRADCLVTHYTGACPPPYLAVRQGRIRFEPPPGRGATGGAAPFGSVLFLYGAVSEAHVNDLQRAGFRVWRLQEEI